MALSHAERGRLGAQKLNSTLTAEQRKENARKAHLASLAQQVADRAPEFTPEQIRKILTALDGVDITH